MAATVLMTGHPVPRLGVRSCCSRSRPAVSDPMVEVYDKARIYRDLLQP